MNSLSLYKWKRKDVESCAAALSDSLYAQARRGQLVYGGGDFNMRQKQLKAFIWSRRIDVVRGSGRLRNNTGLIIKRSLAHSPDQHSICAQ